MKIDPKRAAVIGLAATTIFTLAGCRAEDNEIPDVYGPETMFDTHSPSAEAVSGTGAASDTDTNVSDAELLLKATLLKKKDIKDIIKAEMFIEGEMREVTDEKVLGKVEAEIRKGRKLKGRSACPFDTPMYITMKDGTYGMIYPAMDSCDAFITADGEYEFKKHKNYGLCAILGWTNEVYPSLHVTPME